MIMKKLEKVNEDVFQKKRAVFEAAVPNLKKFFHLIAQSQWIICLYQARENEKDPNNYTYYRDG